LVKQRTFEITEKYRQMGQIPPDVEVTQNIAYDCILKEISATLAHRKRLRAQVDHLQNEIMQMERASEQKVVVTSTVPVATVKPHTVNSKPRKSREHRSRSQEWPDVPDVGKIEEQNPEILAQKILETGRQIEAGKISKPNVIVNGYVRDSDRLAEQHRAKTAPVHRTPPQPQPRPQQQTVPLHRHSPVKSQKPLNVVSKVQESPKVINFEDRLKSIITSVLNEDQEQRKAARQTTPTHPFANGYVRPTPAQGAAYARPTPAAVAAPVQYQRPGAARDLRRERYAYERREPARAPAAHYPAHAAHAPLAAHLDQRHHHLNQPDYTQVSISQRSSASIMSLHEDRSVSIVHVLLFEWSNVCQ
jgi:hypothetical protein